MIRTALLLALVAGCGGAPSTGPATPATPPPTENAPAATAPVRAMPSGWWVDVEDAVNAKDVGTGGYFEANGFKLVKNDGTVEQVAATITPDGENRWKLKFPDNQEVDQLALTDGGRALTLTRPGGEVVKFRIASVAETDKFNGAR